MSRLDNIIIYNKESSEIINKLDRYGICILCNYLSDENIKSLTKEHEDIYNYNDPNVVNIHGHPTNHDGIVARCKLQNLSRRFSTTIEVFQSNLMKDVSVKYFNTDKINLNEDIFFTYEKASDTPILPWHFDRQQSLKFYINLIDVDSINGAMEYDLGSHREGHFRANYYILSGTEIGKIPNDIPEGELRNPVTITAKAGDLVIFDPDGFHRGGIVAPGHERKVVRAHTHPLPNRGYSPGLFDANWWLNSPFNLAKYLFRRATRNLPPERLTKSELRKY